jgi:hypothetical protein
MGDPSTGFMMSLKEITGIVSNIVTIAVVVVGGIFSWWKWGREKPQASRGNLAHSIFLGPLDSDRFVLHITLEIQNKGNVALHVESGWTEVRKISPVDKDVEAVLARSNPFGEDGTQIDWPAAQRRLYEGEKLSLWIDSGETERLFADFVLLRTHQVVAIRSEISMKGDKPGTIWPITTFVHTSDLLRRQTLDQDPGSLIDNGGANSC